MLGASVPQTLFHFESHALWLYFFISSSYPVYEAGTFITLFWGNQDSERLSCLAGVTQLVNDQVRTGAQISLMPKAVLFLSESVLRWSRRRGSVIGGGGERKRSTHSERFALDTGHAEAPGEEERERGHQPHSRPNKVLEATGSPPEPQKPKAIPG